MKPLDKYKGLAKLVLLLTVAPIFVWQYSVSGTVNRWRTTVIAQRQITELRDTQTNRGDRYELPTSDSEMILSGLVVAKILPSIEVEELRIEHYTPYITSEAEGIRLATGQLTVQGGFAGIVRLLDEIERALPDCKVVSVHYRTARPRNRNTAKTLRCTIYIQQITLAD